MRTAIPLGTSERHRRGWSDTQHVTGWHRHVAHAIEHPVRGLAGRNDVDVPRRRQAATESRPRECRPNQLNGIDARDGGVNDLKEVVPEGAGYQ
jgi:hypothetical protein